MTTENNPYRLDRTVVPSAYRIFMTPDLEKATFAGRVEIDVEITESTKEVKLNAIELDLGAATLTIGGTAHRSTDLHLDNQYEVATYTFDAKLPVGSAVLEIAFTGILNDQLHGFYRSTFTDPSGVKHTIATTQFENTDARRAFPCWDEPAFKATYQVNLTVPSHLAAYSNSPVSSDTDLGNGQRTVSFTPTMKMSTYLVAFVIGPFEETEALDVDGVPLRIVFPIGNAHLTEHALEAGAFALRYFSDYFDIPYPGDKLDMLAIPDFMQGAMENLGCITYRMPDLLIDPAKASLAEMKRVAKVVMHEIAHMWFGDLVTMEWWEGIWLNEAFATFMEVMCQDAFRPQWKVWVTFSSERDLALEIDGLHATRPVEYEVVSPDDTQGMFDRLTYEKGAGILHMLEQYLGAETYRDGIRNYLRKHSYANTVTTDLWDAIEEISGEPVRDVMNTWILQGGYPLVIVERRSDQPAALRLRPRDWCERDRFFVEGPRLDALVEGRRAQRSVARGHAARGRRRGAGRTQRRRIGLLPNAIRRHRTQGTVRPHLGPQRAGARRVALGQLGAVVLEPDQRRTVLDDRRRTRQPRRADAVGHARGRRWLHRSGTAHRATPPIRREGTRDLRTAVRATRVGRAVQ